MRLLTVCTANVCRSPMAAALLRHHLPGAVVTSAGTRAVDLASPPEAAKALSELGVDLRPSPPRQLTLALLTTDAPDLVIAMSREHLREVAVLDPSCWPRTFTLKELVRGGTDVGPRSGEPLDAWLGRVGGIRRRVDVLRDDLTDDVADPFGRSLGVYRRTAAELEGLTRALAALLSG